MAKFVKYKNGYKGTVSDKVAVILERKGEVKIIGDAKAKPEPEAKTAPKPEGGEAK